MLESFFAVKLQGQWRKMKFLCGGYQEPVREKLLAELHTDMVLVKESTGHKRGSAVPMPPRRHANGLHVRADESTLAFRKSFAELKAVMSVP